MHHSDDEIMELFFDTARMSRYVPAGNTAMQYMGQYRCLFLLADRGKMHQHELAALMQIRPASLSELLAKLARKGLVRREEAENNRRARMVSLTDAGRKAAAMYRRRRAAVHCDMLSCLTDEEKQQFYYILTKIQQNSRREQQSGND